MFSLDCSSQTGGEQGCIIIEGVSQINILITGGARSGKSSYAQELASESGEKVLFVATAEALDEEMRQRIEEHKRNRPSSWTTLEITAGVGDKVLEKIGNARIVIIDCITLLINSIFNRATDLSSGRIDTSLAEKEVEEEINGLIDCMNKLDAGFIIVTNEVGMGLVPANETGRLYRDLLGRANSILAGYADEVYLMVSGLPVRIKP